MFRLLVDSGFTFQPEMFLEGLKYLGLGMLGIFIVVAIIAAVTILLVNVFKGKE